MKRNLHYSRHENDDTRSSAERKRSARRGAAEDGFRCVNCGAQVITDPLIAGVLNRNHCPYCLWSRHLDLVTAGDRMCACKAPMRPIGLTLKQTHKKYAREESGELMLIHSCIECGSLSINRIAADDLSDHLYAVFERSLSQNETIRSLLADQPIRLLVEADRRLVQMRLFGRDD